MKEQKKLAPDEWAKAVIEEEWRNTAIQQPTDWRALSQQSKAHQDKYSLLAKYQRNKFTGL